MINIFTPLIHILGVSLLILLSVGEIHGSMVLPYRQYLPGDGLSSRDVWFFLEDPSNGIWVGTSSGLDVITARGIRSFGPDDGLDNPAALAFTLDTRGRFWVATESGVYSYSDSSFVCQTALDHLAGRVTAMAKGTNGELYIAAGSTLYRWFSDTLETVDFTADSLLFDYHENDLIHGIATAGDSLIWLAREISGLWLLNRHTNSARCILWRGNHIRTSHQLDVSRSGLIIGEVSERLICVDARSGHTWEMKSCRIEDRLLGYAENEDGQYWIADRRSLWNIDQHGRSTPYLLDLPDYVMRQILIDREGSIWIATAGSGVVRIVDVNLQNLLDGLVNTAISIFPFSPDSIIVTTDRDMVLLRPNSAIAKHIRVRESGTSSSIRGNEQTEIWAVTEFQGIRLAFGEAGISEFLNDTTIVPIPAAQNLLARRFMTSIFNHRHYGLLIGTTSGLLAYRDGQLREITGFPSSTVINHITEGFEGEVLIGTTGLGLWVLHDGKAIQSARSAQLPVQSVYAIHRQEPLGVWIGTSAGLSLLQHDGSVRTWDTGNGLGHNIVTALTSKNSRYLWIGLDCGVQCFDVENSRFSSIINSRVGLSGDEVTTQSALVFDTSGILWCGFFGGVSSIDTDRLALWGPGPKVNIEAILIDGTPRDTRGLLPYGNHELVFSCAEKTLRWPNLCEFTYRLDGTDKTWIHTQGRDIRYTHLSRGNHRFHIRARIPFSEWGPETTIDLSVNSPFWMKTPFMAGALIGIVGLIWGIVKTRTWQLERDRRKLEQIVMERTLQLSDALSAVEERSIQLENALTEVRELSLTDDLTGLPNRRSLMHRLPGYLAQAERTGEYLSLLMIDLDGFKQLNDTLGHDSGDAALKHVSGLLHTGRRKSDVIFRFGGDEFICVLPGTPSNYAVDIAEKMRSAVEYNQPPQRDNSLTITLSIGIAVFDPVEHKDAESLIKDADRALYRSKESGRNMVTLFSSFANSLS